MKILLIEHLNYKSKEIISTLESLNQTDVTHEKTKNEGLSTFDWAYKNGKPFDFVICGNAMPKYNGYPWQDTYADYILENIRKHVDSPPVCVCSALNYVNGMPKGDYVIPYDFKENELKPLADIIEDVIYRKTHIIGFTADTRVLESHFYSKISDILTRDFDTESFYEK